MPETAILNADVSWQADIQDSIGPDYGWERLRRSQLAIIKPAFGRPWSRTVGNGGHSTTFSWMGRSGACVERLKQWAEQYEDGFFTIVDQDGGGRHYVGRFVGDMPLSQAGHDKYNIQGWSFEEIPGCPMVEYPSEWERWSVLMPPIDDFGDQTAATFSALAGHWFRPEPVANDDGSVYTPRQLMIPAPTAGDWITFEYRGYGFRLWAKCGVSYGIISMFIDGVAQPDIDLYNALELGETMVYENAAIPLGVHRVKLVLTNTKNAAALGTGALIDKLQVMR